MLVRPAPSSLVCPSRGAHQPHTWWQKLYRSRNTCNRIHSRCFSPT